jgi:hypothetical protein
MIGLIVLIVLFTRGLYYSGSDGYIFDGLRRFVAVNIFGLSERIEEDTYIYIDNSSKSTTLREYLFKPIWGCRHCMNSVYGILLCLWVGTSFVGAVIVLAGAVGLSFILEKAFDA